MRYNIQPLVAARMKRGWNQTHVAFHAGLSVSTVSLVESGKRQTPTAIAKMAEVLGVNLESLVVEDSVAPAKSTSKPKQRKAS